MGVIQGSINNLLNTAAVAARLSPGYETKQEIHKTKKELKANAALREARIGARIEEHQKNVAAGTPYHDLTPEQQAAHISELEKDAELKDKLAVLQPTKENFQEALDAKTKARESKAIYEKMNEMRDKEKAASKPSAIDKGEQAMKDMEAAAEAKAASLIRMRKYQHKYGGKK